MSIDPASSPADLGTHPEIPPRVPRSVTWLGSRIDRRFASTIALVTALAVATRGAAAVKDLLVASVFGISDDLDAFVVASLIPTSVLYAFAASSADAFLPIFVRERARGGAAASRLLSSVTALGAVALLAVAAVLALSAMALVAVIGSGFGPEKARLTALLLVGLLPTMVLGGWSSAWPAALNATGREAVTAALPLVTPAITILLLVALFPILGVYSLLAGAVFGAALEVAFLGIALVRQGLPILPSWRGLHGPTVEFGHQVLPLVAAALISVASGVIDQSMAAALGPGAVSAFSYGSKIMVFVTGTAGIILTIVVLPRLAYLAAVGDRTVLRRTFLAYLGAGFVLALAITVVLAGWSREIVGALFERGSFDASDTAAVAPIQALLALQAPFTLGNLLAVRLLVAVAEARAIVATTVLNVGLHYAGNVLLIPVLGVSGIALSATIASVVLFAVLVAISLRALSRRRIASSLV